MHIQQSGEFGVRILRLLIQTLLKTGDFGHHAIACCDQSLQFAANLLRRNKVVGNGGPTGGHDHGPTNRYASRHREPVNDK